MVTTEANPTPPSSSQKLPWIRTPLIESNALSKAAGCRVHMKMDMFQPAGSFKSRGIGNYCLKAVRSRPNRPIHFYSSSGGNAGISSYSLPRPLPERNGNRTRHHNPPNEVQNPASGGDSGHSRRQLVRGGRAHACAGSSRSNWRVLPALRRGGYMGGEQDASGRTPRSARGHGTIPRRNHPLRRRRRALMWRADGPAGAWAWAHPADRGGARRRSGSCCVFERGRISGNVARRAFELACHGNVRSVILSDTQAALGAVRMMDDERVAVEPACGISAAVVYDNVLKKVCPELGPESNVVLVVCGGNSISAEMLAEYRTTYGRLETPAAIHNYAN
ncbi:hypothetical protein HOY82DRAFT_635963 [Tuber indicum]|nr:hypothetical protein HOY82DRAFT_635963 [Tuber indicum]